MLLLSIALVLGSLLAGLTIAFVTRGRPDGRVALGAGLAAFAGNVLSQVFC